MTTDKGTDINVVAEDRNVSGGDREWNLSQSGVERLDVNDGILLVVKTESEEKTSNFDLSVGGPDTDVVTVLVGNTRTFDVKLDVDTVTVGVGREKFFSG